MSVKRLFFFFFQLAVSSSASYRVHELKISYYDPSGVPVKTETVLSTLDHLQYEHYHSGFRVIRAELKDTWYCPGDTSRKKFCEKPKDQASRGPASTDPKRISLPLGRQPVMP